VLRNPINNLQEQHPAIKKDTTANVVPDILTNVFDNLNRISCFFFSNICVFFFFNYTFFTTKFYEKMGQKNS
jgi:hypothetical protein